MAEKTDEKLKRRLKDLYDDSREYSLGQISEASGMALNRIEELEDQLAEADAMIEVQQKDYASNNVRFAEAEYRAKVAEAKLAEVEADADMWQQRALHINEVAGVQIARAEAAEAERDKFHQLWKDACVRSGKNSLRADAAEAALVAVYRLALEDAAKVVTDMSDRRQVVWPKDILALPTPTAAELMARIQTGDPT